MAPSSACPLRLLVDMDGWVVAMPALRDPRQPSPVDPPPGLERFEDERVEVQRVR